MRTRRKILAASPPGDLRIVGAIGSCEIMAAASDGAEPKLPRLRMVAYTGGPMHLWGWDFPVIVDLAGLKLAAEPLPILKDHSVRDVVGHTSKVDIGRSTLELSGVISGTGPAAREVRDSAANQFPWRASIGAAAKRVEELAAGASATVNGLEAEGPAYIVRESVLREVSVVAIDADGDTQVEVAAAAAHTQGAKHMDFEAWLKAKGFDPKVLTEDQTKTLKAAYEAEQKPADDPPADPKNAPPVKADGAPPAPADGVVADIRATAVAERKRIAAVVAACGGRHADIEARALAEGWTQERTELEVLRTERPKAPAVGASRPSPTALVLEAAACLSGRLAGIEKQYDEKTLEAAGRVFNRGIGLQELLMEAAWAAGYGGSRWRGAEEEILRAAFSTTSLAGILSNVANKFLLQGFMAVESAWRLIAAIRPVDDFKTITSYRMTGDLEFEEVAPTGELKHGTLGDAQFTNQAQTHGKLLTIPRTDLVNDDLGALTVLPVRIGRGGALKLNTVFWTKFLKNAAFFKAANRNYADGTDTALTIDGLTAAELLFLDQVDPDGKPLAVPASILLVPNALKVRATNLMKSDEVRDTNANTKYPTANPHAGKFTPVASAYLSNAKIAGNSSKAWYLLARPEDLPVIEVVFLNGVEQPTVESAEADFSVLGIQMRGYFDFGVELQDPLGGVKMKGEV